MAPLTRVSAKAPEAPGSQGPPELGAEPARSPRSKSPSTWVNRAGYHPARGRGVAPPRDNRGI
ncbi:hypothetical protein E4U13_002209 [Claviceps humidiphila]|uniref:Uncharacterized protein n=1 Tax=Claviceps humidiphila TaxID=1294629 RepID=A0A9P7TXF1_9HYPO|nr:hypothetical protein E4U13_002209 [Claviceps humidiphila]